MQKDLVSLMKIRKISKKRLQILLDYKKDVIKFGLINLFAMLLLLFFQFILRENPYEMTLIPYGICALLFFVTFFLMLRELYNRNPLLWLSSMLIWAYVISFSEPMMGLIMIFVVFSFIYEVIVRFWLGIRIEIKLKEYPWSFEKNAKSEVSEQ